MIPTQLTYREQLQPWCIVRQLPKMQRIVVARFRHRPEAEAYLTVLRRLLPSAPHVILFGAESRAAQSKSLQKRAALNPPLCNS